MSLILAGQVRFAPELVAEAETAMVELMHATRRQDGCIRSAYSRELAEPGLYRVYQVWRDETAFDGHHEGPHFERWREARLRLGIHDRSYWLHEIAATHDA